VQLQTSSLLPEQASNFAGRVDALMLYILGTSLFFALLVVILVVIFSLKYRRQKKTEIGVPLHGSVPLEIFWTLVPLVLAMVMFAWGAVIYMDFRHAPADTMDVYVIGKQWMWKLQHADGRREINELHVPVGRDVKLIMASEDVIHDFSIPNFRIKMDVVPGRYTTLWFRATKTGRYHFYCSQYCGTSHALMIGWVTVMEPAEYAAWLSGGADSNQSGAGEKLFAQYSCSTCHLPTGTGRGPSLVGLYGSKVKLTDGTTVVADDAYIRESIVSPKAKVVAGYQPLMPSFQGLITEEQVLSLTAYIKSLQAPAAASEASAGAPHMGKK